MLSPLKAFNGCLESRSGLQLNVSIQLGPTEKPSPLECFKGTVADYGVTFAILFVTLLHGDILALRVPDAHCVNLRSGSESILH